jgi:hypothetical protein
LQQGKCIQGTGAAGIHSEVAESLRADRARIAYMVRFFFTYSSSDIVNVASLFYSSLVQD